MIHVKHVSTVKVHRTPGSCRVLDYNAGCYYTSRFVNEYVARKTVTKNVRKHVTKNDTQHIAFLFSDPVWLRPEYPVFCPLFKNSKRAK